MSQAVKAIVRNYGRLLAWLDARELQQEAALTTLKARRTWRPERGPWESYRSRAVALQIMHLVDRERSPVSAWAGEDKNLRGLERAPMATLNRRPAPARHVESRLDLDRATAEVRRIVALHSPAAQAVLLAERQPAEVAAALGVPVQAVYRQTRDARAALAKSRRLRELAAGLGSEVRL